MAGTETPDCRWAPCNQCGVRPALGEECNAMQAQWRDASRRSEDARSVMFEKREEPPPVQRMRFRVGRLDEARFLSNLEWMSAWIRALRRARLPVSHSQGFHAHPKVTFATAPPVGEESEADYMDVVLRERVEPVECLARLQAAIPMGLYVHEASEVPLNSASLMSAVTGFDYLLFAEGDAAAVSSRIRSLIEADSVHVERKGRPTGPRRSHNAVTIDIRPAIAELSLESCDGERLCIRFGTRIVDGRLAKTREIVQLLGLDPQRTRALKTATHLTS